MNGRDLDFDLRNAIHDLIGQGLPSQVSDVQRAPMFRLAVGQSYGL
jgi:hypothetical protein